MYTISRALYVFREQLKAADTELRTCHGADRYHEVKERIHNLENVIIYLQKLDGSYIYA